MSVFLQFCCVFFEKGFFRVMKHSLNSLTDTDKGGTGTSLLRSLVTETFETKAKTKAETKQSRHASFMFLVYVHV